jgi:hypothetical protein
VSSRHTLLRAPEGGDDSCSGNQKADREAKWAAFPRGQTSVSLSAALFLCPLSEWDPWYTSQKQAWFESEGGNFLLDGRWKFTDCHIAIPESLGPTFVKWRTSLRADSSWDHLGPAFLCPKLSNISKTVCEICSLCARNNPSQGPRCKYLLAFVCTVSR